MREKRVHRPSKKTEHKIFFASLQAEKSWRDLEATKANLLVATWHLLADSPTTESPLCYKLKGPLAEISKGESTFERWQIKLSQGQGARIWYWVDGHNVFIENVFTSHPNATK